MKTMRGQSLDLVLKNILIPHVRAHVYRLVNFKVRFICRGTQNNFLSEAVLLSSHSMCYG